MEKIYLIAQIIRRRFLLCWRSHFSRVEILQPFELCNLLCAVMPFIQLKRKI